ncbi:MAG TPA: hypothetical protein VKY74_03610, partial [Chloroflexia bacterium]|nr:hypothetical protein [Chloroflexia bacterium]
WNGSSWRIVPTPSVARSGSGLLGIAAIGANDIWAVGGIDRGRGNQPLIEHWNGDGWRIVPSPNIGSGGEGSQLVAVAAVAADDVWAVGAYNNPGPAQTLVEHWNGCAWNVVSSFGPGLLTGVTAAGANDVWAVGQLYNPDRPLIEHWDGTSWSSISNPGQGALYDIATDATHNAWAVGNDNIRNQNSALVERYIAACGAPNVATPLPMPTMTATPVPISYAFPETGQTVKGRFLDYWDTHGCLAQQGYPLTTQIRDKSASDGQFYMVQYFERAVFEAHPENPPPYDVLLSLLGTFRYQQKYPQSASNQEPNTSPGSVFFPQTGKRLGGRFLAYWQSHGGLAQQGYPISDEFTEVSDLNGQPYKVQYFQRAVFEWHPENQPPYDVLLSQLGTYYLQKK